MQLRKISSVLLTASSVAATFALSSCITDETTLGGNTLSQLTIDGISSTKLPEVNVDLGDTCIIAPNFKQEGGTSGTITGTWSVGSYTPSTGAKGTLTQVATGSTFRHFFPTGGDYYVHLNATNGQTGLAQDYIVHVNRTFEDGILITAVDADGTGNLSFIKTLTPEDSAAGKTSSVREHCVELLNPGINMQNLVGASNIYTQSGTEKMLVALQDRCYFIDPNTFELIQTVTYSDVYPGFVATDLFALPSSSNYPYVYDRTSKKYIHIDRDYQYGYQHASIFFKNPGFEDIFKQGKPSYNGTDFYYPAEMYVNYSTSEVAEWSPYTSTTYGSKVSTYALLADQDVISVFRRKSSATSAPAYVLTQSKATPSTVRLYTLVLDTEGRYGSVTNPYREIYNASYVEQTGVSASIIPAQGTRMIESKDYNVVFFAIGAKLYSYFAFNTNPTLPTSETLDFGSETITSLTMNEATQELYVGTYDVSTQRGSLRVYDVATLRAGSAPKLYYPSCTGKIIDVRYK